MRKLVPALVILTLASCKEEPQKEKQTTVSHKIAEAPKPEMVRDAVYSEFKPESITGLKIKGFDVEKAFSVGENTIVTGNYSFIDGKAALPDTEKDWGNRLLMLNNKNEIMYTSKGSGETYLYEPHFYKNSQNGNIIIVCQQAFEYFFGGEAFLLEKGKIKYLGNLDIEPNDERKKLTDILRIQESNKEITFTFDADSLVLKPGSEDIVIRNNNAKYIYDQHSLTLHQ